MKKTIICLLILASTVSCLESLNDLGFNTGSPGFITQEGGFHCQPGCAVCGSYGCEACFRRKLTEETGSGGSGRTCEKTILPPNPVSDYDINEYIRYQPCKSPSAYDQDTRKCVTSHPVANCASYGYSGINSACDSCYGGVPEGLGRTCTGFPSSKFTNWTNCKIGTFSMSSQQFQCAMCKEGYFVDKLGFCKKQTGPFMGCLLVMGYTCQICDVSNGYYQPSKYNQCVKF